MSFKVTTCQKVNCYEKSPDFIIKDLTLDQIWLFKREKKNGSKSDFPKTEAELIHIGVNLRVFITIKMIKTCSLRHCTSKFTSSWPQTAQSQRVKLYGKSKCAEMMCLQKSCVTIMSHLALNSSR